MNTKCHSYHTIVLRLIAVVLYATVSYAALADDSKAEQLLREFDKTKAMKTANEFLKELQHLKFFDNPIQFAPKDKADTLQQQVWYWAAEYYYDRQQYELAADYAKQALPMLHIPGEQADCMSLISLCYVRLADYQAAAEYARKCYEIDVSSGDADRQSSSLNTLTGIYLYANQPKEAEKYVLRGIDLANQAGNSARLAVLQGKAAEVYHALGNDEEALEFAEAAYRIDKRDGRDDKAAMRLSQKASVLIGLHRYGEAERVLNQIIPIFRQLGNRQSLGIACNQLGEALHCQQRPDEAIRCYREAANIFSTLGDNANELHARRGLYELLWKSDPDAAKAELDRFNALKDSIYNNMSAESLAKYNAKFGNDWLQVENHAERMAKRRAIIVGVVVSFLLIVLAIAIWWVMRHRHRRQQFLNRQLTTNIDELRKRFETLTIQYDNAMITRKRDEDDHDDLKQADCDFLEKVINIINTLINEGQLDAAGVAQRMGLSSYQFRTRLSAVTGETPQDFIQVIRMRRARHLLDRHHELNITEVAQLCAYNDAPSFTRAFKKVFGLTPTQYLERQEQAKKS